MKTVYVNHVEMHVNESILQRSWRERGNWLTTTKEVNTRIVSSATSVTRIK
jgi:hypothetical protein